MWDFWGENLIIYMQSHTISGRNKYKTGSKYLYKTRTPTDLKSFTFLFEKILLNISTISYAVRAKETWLPETVPTPSLLLL